MKLPMKFFPLSQCVNKVIQMTLHRSIAWTLLVGQILGLMPVCGIFANNMSSLKFAWKSLRFFYTIIILIGSILNVIFIFMWIITDEISLNTIMIFLVYVSNLLNVVIFFRIGLKWSKLVKLWSCLKLNFPSSLFVIPKNYLKRKMNLILMIIIGISLGKWKIAVHWSSQGNEHSV